MNHVQVVISLQERHSFRNEDELAIFLSDCLGWNIHYAALAAELAWIELYSEKEEKE